MEFRGSGLAGAEQVLVTGKGVSATPNPDSAKADERFRPLWQSKCGSCHELRSPANRSLTPAQWAATVERMVRVRNAPLSADEQTKVTEYLVGMARAGRVMAKVTIAPDAEPGLREVRVVTSKGVSTACRFEIGGIPEVTGANGKREDASKIDLPVLANGSLTGNAERHFYRFDAKQGQRYVFDLKGFRFSEASQLYFNPNLRLYDSSGKEIAENHGYYDLDPLLDWTCTADGEYTLEVRDLLGRGNPGSVYRLSMRPVPPDFKPESPANGSDRPRRPDEAGGRRGQARFRGACVVRPDNITLRPGLSTALEVLINRRDGLIGEVELVAVGLPEGVEALPSSIPADMSEGRLILTASSDSKPAAQPIQVLAVVKGTAGENRIPAVPQEVYRLNNNPRAIDREQCVLAVRGQAEFSASVPDYGTLPLSPRRGTQVRVQVKRSDAFKGPIVVRLVNLPEGWFCGPETVPAERSEVTLLVRPDGRNPAAFLNRDPKLPPVRAVLEAGSEEIYFSFGSLPTAKGD